MPIYASKFTGAGTELDTRFPAAAYGSTWYRTAVVGDVAFSNVAAYAQTLPSDEPGIDPAAADTVVYLAATLDTPMTKNACTNLKSKHGISATVGETPRQLGTRLGIVFGGGN